MVSIAGVSRRWSYMINIGFMGSINNYFINLGRYFVAAASVVTIFASGFLIFAGIWKLFNGLPEIVNLLFLQKEFEVELPVLFISAIDSFMVAVVMFVLGIGLYKLFVDENLSSNNLKWFEIYDLYDLKEKLIATSVVVLLITFVKKIVTWKNPVETMYFGGSIAVVIMAITLFSKFVVVHEIQKKKDEKKKE